ncbi:DUF2147 domain-containing protein [Endozoicomonas numazuensis]|uniref:Signal peptide protein n=1 Tax=Endozoicomonas numazuensis TaxID=1137799 RepID=A0A081NEW6_9GAMM|nr:DUF2147 domain-containing protein [Endozoicomonas numazuensis]KEQ16989.1 signal peptide protein [Endozoicomonas numazuensis]
MLRKVLLTASILIMPAISFANGYVGQWHTVNEDTKKAESLVTIWEEGDELKGKIERILDPEARDMVCEKCEGDKKNKKLEGLTFIWGMEKEGSQYDDGKILDPTSGKIYSASMKLIEKGEKLEVRGYLGFAMLGRTQVWVKAE